jgi:hypothetical protein
MRLRDSDPSELLTRTRRAWSPDGGAAARVRAALDANLAAAAAVTTGPAAPVRPARLLLAGTVAVALGGAGYWAGYAAGRRAAPAPVVIVSAPAAPADSAAPVPPMPPTKIMSMPVRRPAADVLQPSGPAPSIHRETRVARHAAAGAPSGEGGSLAIELRALRNAERALRDDRPGLALAFLQDLDRQVPHGELTEEREATAILARCARGEQPFGVNLGDQFTSRYPTSVYRARVEQVCARTDAGPSGDSRARRSGP